ncbi:MAG: mechanosensitive ion channel domain-containing protein [Thermomicrobiales bacterium]
MESVWNQALQWAQDFGWGLLSVLSGLLTAVAYIGVGTLLGRYISQYVVRILSSRSFGRNGALMIGRLVTALFIIVSILMLFGRLGANWTGLLTFVSASAVAVSLSIQDVLRNFVAGIYLLLERPFRVGDRIRVRDVVGEVQGVDVRTTLLKNEEGELVLVPNAIVFTEIIANRSHFRVRRIDFTVTNLKQSIQEIEESISLEIRDMEEVRLPIPASRVTASGPTGRSVVLSLLVDADDRKENEIIERILPILQDAEVQVSHS